MSDSGAPSPRRPRPTVLVDTTEFQSRPRLDGSGWQKLLGRQKRGEIQLAISEVTLREANRQVSEKLAKHRDHLADLHVLGVGDEPVKALRDEIERVGSSFRSDISGQIEAAGGRILDLPNLTIAEVLERDIAAIKPFNRDGKGFRDTLIWTSFVTFISESSDVDGPILVVTGNKTDFGEGQLHRDLANDLPREAVERTTVVGGLAKLHERLDDYFRDTDNERTAELEASRAGVAQNEDDLDDFDDVDHEPLSLTEIVDRYLPSAADEMVGLPVADRDADDAGWGHGVDLGELMPWGVTDSFVTGASVIDFNSEFDVVEAFEGDTYLISASADVELTVEGMIQKADYHVMDDDDLAVTDWDINDHTMSVEFVRTVRATFNLTIIGETMENSELDYVADIGSVVRSGWFVTFTDGVYETEEFPAGHYATAVAKVQSVRDGAAKLQWVDAVDLPTTVRVAVLESGFLRRLRDGVLVRSTNSGLRPSHGATVVSSGWNYHDFDPTPWVRIPFRELGETQKRKFLLEAHASATSELQ